MSKRSAKIRPAALPAAPATAARLALELGVAIEVIERLQGATCVAGVDFIEADGETILTDVAATKIRIRVAEQMLGEAIAAPLAVPPSAHEPAAQNGSLGPHREDLRLTRVFRWSRNVLAELSNGNEVTVTVRSIAHLEPGMLLRGCIQGEMGWTYEGRLPRTMGERQLYFPPIPAAAKGQP